MTQPPANPAADHAPTPNGDPPAAPDALSPASPRRRLNPRLLGKAWRRRTRWIWRILLGGPLLLFILALFLMRSPLVAFLARGAIEPLLGCKMHAGAVAISLDGRLIMDELSLSVPGIESPAGEFLFVRRAEADLDWSGLLRGKVNPTGLRLHEPRFRVSQSTRTGQISIADLKPAAQSNQRLTQPPTINVLDGVVEVGEHTPAAGSTAYRELTRLNVSGSLEPSDPLRPIYVVRLQEKIKVPVDQGGSVPSARTPPVGSSFSVGMIVDGSLDLDHSTARIRVVNIGLSPWPPGSVPTYMRDVWARLNIQGRISETLLTYDPASGPEASITVDQASMNALIPAADHAGKPDDMLSLQSVVGTIKVSTARVAAELDATILGQSAPAHLSLNYAGLTEDAPFTCTITTNQFRVDRNPEWLAFTPLTVKENLAAFSGPTALITGTVTLERGPPEAPGLPAPLRVSGSLDFADGTAAFHRVPYPFKDMTGHIEFDQTKITLARIDGRADSGATVHATGWIAPPDKSAEISLHIVVDNIPLDHVFSDSLPPSRRGAMSFLFSPDRYAALHRQGLISSRTTRLAAMRSRADYERERNRLLLVGSDDLDSADIWIDQVVPVLDELDAQILHADRLLRAPEFDLGGLADLDIRVHSPPGEDAPWQYTVMVDIPRAGFLLRAFPIPVVGSDVRLRITQDTATLLRGTFAGLSGGRFDVDADVILDQAGEAVVMPTVRLRAAGLPIDERLRFAVQQATDSAAASPSPPVTVAADRTASASTPSATGLPSLDRLWPYLDLTGELSCDVSVWPTSTDTIDARAEVAFTDAQLGPFSLADGSRLWASNLEGLVRLDTDRLAVPFLRADLRTHTLAGSIHAPRFVAADAGSFTIVADAALTSPIGQLLGPVIATSTPSEQATASNRSRDQPAPMTPTTRPFPLRRAAASLFLSDVDASLDAAPIIALFAPSAAGSISALTSQYHPSGRIDAELSARIEPDLPITLWASLTRAAPLSLTIGGEPHDLDLDAGVIALTASLAPDDARAGTPPALSLLADAARFRLRSADAAPASLVADGYIVLPALASLDAATPAPIASSSSLPSSLTLRADALALESCLVRSLLAPRLGSAAADLDALDPRGSFSADLSITYPPPSPPASADAPRALSISGSVFLHHLSLVRGTTRIEIPAILGEITFDGTAIRTDGFALVADDWSIALQGRRFSPASDSTSGLSPASIELAAVAHAESLTPALRAALPADVLRRFDDASAQIAGPISFDPIIYSSSASASSTGTPAERIEGTLDITGLSIDTPLTVAGAAGRCDFTLSRSAPEAPWSFTTRLRSPRLTLAGLDVRSVEAHARTGASPDIILIPSVAAECYSGRITGSASIFPSVASATPDTTAPDTSTSDTNPLAVADPAISIPREYRAELTIAGVRFAPILDALAPPAPTPAAAASLTATPVSTAASTSRGSVDAAVSLAGVIGRPETRTGLGRLRIAGGDVIRMPFVMSLMQISNFQLPAKDSFDYLQASFQLAGPTLTFDQIALISRTLAITGFGTMSWPDQRLDLRFNSRSAGRLPLVSDVVEALRNEVMTTRITGTLMQPSIDTEPLLGTRQLIGSALGQPTGPKRSVSEQDADAAARAERDRLKGTSSVPTEP